MTVPPTTFHRRPLPPTCTALRSTAGRERFDSSLAKRGLKSFFPLMEQLTTQSEPAFCGISSLVVVLNALSVDPKQVWKGPWRWYEESMLNCFVDLDEVKKKGITLSTFVCLARCQGLQVESHLASESSLEEFREAVRRACFETKEHCRDDATADFLVVSYSRKVLQQTGDGHFSPLAAYDETTDEVLILDTVRFKYGPHWVSLELLYEAMHPKDSATNKSRGYVLLSYPESDEHRRPPISILFRTEKSQNPLRYKYKQQFLNNQQQRKEITWEEALSFWTKKGTNNLFVWEVMFPQLLPFSNNGDDCMNTSANEVEAVRDLIRQLLPTQPLTVSGCQHSNHDSGVRTICLNPIHAIFIIYLASLPIGRRCEVVMDTKVSAHIEARQQLLAEAYLVQLAIDCCDGDCVY